MIIQHNIMALNAHRQLSNNNTIVSKNLEKLSSGYRINRAGDDAAGLAISEKMRSQIKGLERAQSNAQDGISLVQTAEGALTEVHSMLNRMVELGVESANGTIQASDRQKIQDEVDALTEEINRISKATNFNGIKLLDGSLGGAGGAGGSTGSNGAGNILVAGAGALGDVAATAGAYSVTLGNGTPGDAGVLAGTNVDIKIGLSDGTSKTVSFVAAAALDGDGLKAAIEKAFTDDAFFGANFNVALDNTNLGLTFTAKNAGTATPAVSGIEISGYSTNADGSFNAAITADADNIFTHTAVAGAPSTAVPGAEKNINTDTIAKDAYKQINLGLESADLKNKSITVGDKTYTFVSAADQFKVKDGETAIVMGNNRNETTAALVAALQKDGVKSASVDGINIRIGNTDELKSSKGYAMSTGSVNGIKLGGSTEVNATYTIDVAAAGTAAAQKLTVNYTDKDGKAQTAILDYMGSTTKADNTKAMMDAINNDAILKDLFTATMDVGVGDEIVLSAKGGADGAVLTNMVSSEGTVITATTPTVTSGFNAGQTIDLDNANLKDGDTVTINGKTFEFTTAANIDKIKEGNTAVIIGTTKALTSASLAAALKGEKITAKVDLNNNVLIEYDGATNGEQGGLTLQIGDTSEEFNRVTVSVSDMSAKGLGIQGIQVTDSGLASDSIDAVNAAVEIVSTARGKMGALQNRLEHTINNLGVTNENMTAAESRIRDVDMAKEMMSFTKNNVIAQAAQAMLAQANQQPQQVLQLLR